MSMVFSTLIGTQTMPSPAAPSTQMPTTAEIRGRVATGRDARSRTLAQGLRAGIHALRAALTALRLRRETIAQLRLLSDRELADIGLDRGAIPAAAAQAVPANDRDGRRDAA